VNLGCHTPWLTTKVKPVKGRFYFLHAHYIYDANERRFQELCVLGQVPEYRYDVNGHEVLITGYANASAASGSG
jgi:hypothetical protein